MKTVSNALHAIGSLWFAAVLLTMWLVAMACATAYESMHGTPRALATFYYSWWFEGILGLIAVNNLAALITRFPYSRKLIGFAITHLSILIILVGALVTQQYRVEGQVGLREGQSTDLMLDRYVESVKIINRDTEAWRRLDLPTSVSGSFAVVENPSAATFDFEGVGIRVTKFLPDSAWRRTALADSRTSLPAAVEVAITRGDERNREWIFSNRNETIGRVNVAFRPVTDTAALRALLDGQDPEDSTGGGILHVTIGSEHFDLPLVECGTRPVPIGTTGYTLRVAEYLPRAVVGEGGSVINKTSGARNPAVRFEVTQGDVRETRVAFANFPEFRHGDHELNEIEVTFEVRDDWAPRAPIEILQSPAEELFVRFSPRGQPARTTRLDVDEPIDLPDESAQLTVSNFLAHAREDRELEPVLPPRETRIPAVHLDVIAGGRTQQLWVQKNRSFRVEGNEHSYDIQYSNRQLPLGFTITLHKFHMGRYPGGRSPRSFESVIEINEPDTGRLRNAVVTMNAPTKHGGLSMFQSSYDLTGGRRTSFLSVSRDPGQPIVFLGYTTLCIGMIVVFLTRALGPKGIAGAEVTR